MDHADLLSLAARQHGVVSDAQALALGYSAQAIRRRVRSGAWQRVLPGVIRCSGAPDSGRQAAMAAYLWAGREAVISHATAGVLWGLDAVATRRIEVTLPVGSNLRSRLVVVHRTVDLPSSDRAMLHGMAVTTVTRNLIDLAGTLSPHQLELAVEDAFRRRLTSPRRLSSRLGELEGSGRPGTGRLRALLDRRGTGPASGSPAETKLERLLVQHGLPRPARQHAITHGSRTIHVDLAYPDRRLAIEFDSLRWHTGRAKLDNDAERRNLLRAANWALITVTYTMLGERSSQLIAAVEAAYEELAPVH
jgi:very-short-patch-repair endonuclease